MTNKEIRLANLKALIQEAESIVAVANASGTSPAYLSQIINKTLSSTGTPVGVGDKLARKLELAFNKSVGWIDIDHGINEIDSFDEAADLLPERKVPVVGEVKGGIDGFLEEQQYPVGHGEGYINWPTKDPNAYAVRVRGDSMHPRYRAGEFVIVEPSKEPPMGEDVVVRCLDGRKMLKVLNWIRGGEVQFLSINNGYAPITMLLTEIDSIQYAAGRAPRSAFIHT